MIILIFSNSIKKKGLGNYRETLFKREKKIFMSTFIFVIIWIFNKPPCGLFQTYISPYFSIFHCPLRPNGFLSVQHLFGVVKRSRPFYSILKHPQATFNFLMFRFSSKAFYCIFKYFIKNDFDRSMTAWDRSMTVWDRWDRSSMFGRYKTLKNGWERS